MKLKHRVKEVYLVDYNDWDNFINSSIKELGHTPKWKFEIVAQEELNNYSSDEYEIDGEKPDEWELEELKEYLNGEPRGISNRLIANYLCSKGLLNPGHYVIRVFW